MRDARTMEVGRTRLKHSATALVAIGFCQLVFTLSSLPVAAQASFRPPSKDTVGLAWDARGYRFWASVRGVAEEGANTKVRPGTSGIYYLDYKPGQVVGEWVRWSPPALQDRWRTSRLGSIAWDGDALWVVDETRRVISRVETDQGLVRTEIQVPEVVTRPWPTVTGLSWDGKTLWLTSKGGLCACLLRLDPDCGTRGETHRREKCVLRHIFPRCEPRGLAYQRVEKDGSEYLWTIAYNGPGRAPRLSRRRIDEKRTTVLTTLEFLWLLPEGEPTAMTFAMDRLWVLDRQAFLVFAVDIEKAH